MTCMQTVVQAIGAVAMPGIGIMFAGGSGPWPPMSISLVDTYTVPFDSLEKHSTWHIEKIPDPTANTEYWPGVAQDGKAVSSVGVCVGFC